MNTSLTRALAALTVCGATFAGATGASAEDKELVVFLGGGLSDNSISTYAGGVWAPSGFSQDGVFVRVVASAGSFDFNTGLAPGGRADADTYGANASVGYRIRLGQMVVAPFVGIDFFERDINPAVADTGQINDNVGVIVGGRVESDYDTTGGGFTWAVDGSWASTNDRYYAEAELGYDFGIATLGPKGAALGNDEYNAYRAGGFAKFDLFDDVALKVTSGYQFGDDNNALGVGVPNSDSSTFFVDTSIALVF